MKIKVGRQKIRRSIVKKVMEVVRSAPIQELTEAEMDSCQEFCVSHHFTPPHKLL